MNEQENNKMYFSGEIVSEPTLTHTVYDEGFYEFDVRIPRLSGAEDILPVTISERLLCGQEIGKGTKINAVGQFRSYNKIEDERSRLVLTAFVQELLTGETEENPNSIMLNGYVCKPPIYRTTPFNREIADLLIAVNRAYNKSDYIPCVAWGRNARFASMLSVGDRIAVSGRVQSRQYEKKYSETDIRKKIAYEVSISKLATHDTDDVLDLNNEFKRYVG